MKEYLEQRIAFLRKWSCSGDLEKQLIMHLISELSAALNHLNKIENEKS